MGRERDLLKAIQEEVNSEAHLINTFLNEILAEYTKELDELITEIENLLRLIKSGEINTVTDDELEMYTLHLPVLMYKAGARLEELGSNSDVAKAKKKERYNEIMLKVSGTIPEKKAKSEEVVKREQIMEDIYSRAYEQLKTKLDYADRINNGIKKALSKRMMELEVFRKDKDRGGEQ